jgi:hypothetical protein
MRAGTPVSEASPRRTAMFLAERTPEQFGKIPLQARTQSWWAPYKTGRARFRKSWSSPTAPHDDSAPPTPPPAVTPLTDPRPCLLAPPLQCSWQPCACQRGTGTTCLPLWITVGLLFHESRMYVSCRMKVKVGEGRCPPKAILPAARGGPWLFLHGHRGVRGKTRQAPTSFVSIKGLTEGWARVHSSLHCQHAFETAMSIDLPVADLSAELAQLPITAMSTNPTSCPAGSSALGIQFPGEADGAVDDVDVLLVVVVDDDDDGGGGGGAAAATSAAASAAGGGGGGAATRAGGVVFAFRWSAIGSCDAALSPSRADRVSSDRGQREGLRMPAQRQGQGPLCECPRRTRRLTALCRHRPSLPLPRVAQHSGKYKTNYSTRRGGCSTYALGAGCRPEPYVPPQTYYTWKGVKICAEQASVPPTARRLGVFLWPCSMKI